MFEIKQLTKFVILINILFIGFLLGILISSNINATSDNNLIYNFKKDTLYSSNNPIDSSFNTREYEVWEHDGHFNATYSFTDEAIGTSGTNIDFIDIDSSDSNSGATIISSLDGHKNVLQLSDKDASEQFNITHNFDKIQPDGTIEFWGAITKTGAIQLLMEFREGSTKIIEFLFQSDDLYYDSTGVGGWVFIKEDFIVLGEFNHYKIIWDDNTNSFDIYIDSILEGNDLSYGNLPTIGIDEIRMWSYISNPQLSFYFDAIGFFWPISYTDVYFNVGTQDILPTGITWDGESFWVVGDTNNEVYKYNSTGDYQDVHFNVGTQDTSPTAITWDGESFWVVGSVNDKIYKYNLTGDYQDSFVNVGFQDTITTGVSWNGTYLWTVGNETNKAYGYTTDGGHHEDDWFDIGTQLTSPTGITWDNEYFWIVGDANDKIYKYNSEGVYQDVYFSIGAQDTLPTDIIWDGEYFWIVGNTNNKVYQFIIPINDYMIGDNLEDLYYLETSGTESDKWEFLYEGINDKFEDGDDNPNGWTDLEDGEDDVNVRTGGTGYVELYAMSGEILALYKDNLGYSEDIALNVSFNFEIKYIYSILNNDVYMKIYSADNTEIVRIRINNDGSLKYWISGTTYTQLTTGFVIDTDYSINLNVNYDTDKCTLRYTTNGVFTNSFEFPLTATGKTGLKKVYFGICADTDYVQTYLDSIGIYINYYSISTEYAYHKVIPTTDINWVFNYRNLLRYNAIGNISIIMYVQNYGGSYIELQGLTEVDDWDTINLYSLKVGSFYYGIAPIYLYFFFIGKIELNEVDITGVILEHDSIDYNGICEYSGVNQHDNYFYVDNNNKLQFIQTSNDNDLEYIQISFDVPNVQSINRSISYSSLLTGNAQGYFRISYIDDTSTLLPLRTYVSNPNVILPQDKEIDKLIILITDNNNNDVKGTTTGYITSIKLIYLPDVAINIITVVLLSIIIPLLILIIPTFLIYLRLGKTAIIPTFLLMSFICFITNLIPLWLFFIILMSSGVFMVSKKVIKSEG